MERFDGGDILLAAMGLFQLVTLFFVLWIFRKVRRVDIAFWDLKPYINSSLLSHYHQIEALNSLNRLLEFKSPLPPTRGWAASPDFLYQVAQHALTLAPMRIVECSSGTSTIVLARCVELNGSGHVFSLESDHKYAEQTRHHLRVQGLEKYATVLDAPLVPVRVGEREFNWYSLAEFDISDIDLLVIDGPPAVDDPLARYPAGALLFPRLAADSAVFLDDASRPGEQDAILRWESEFPNFRKVNFDAEKGLTVLFQSKLAGDRS
jgi:predicted O-methyltransferase YrrM